MTYRTAHAAMLAAGNPEDAHGIKLAADLDGVYDFAVNALITAAGINPPRLPRSPGVAATDAAAAIGALAEALR